MNNKAPAWIRAFVGAVLCASLAGITSLDRNIVGEAASDGSGWSDDSVSASHGPGYCAILPESCFFHEKPGFLGIDLPGSCRVLSLEAEFSGHSRSPPVQ